MTETLLRRFALILLAAFLAVGTTACDGTSDRVGAGPGTQDPAPDPDPTPDPDPDPEPEPEPDIATISGTLFALEPAQAVSADGFVQRALALLNGGFIGEAFAQAASTPGLAPQQAEDVQIAIFDPQEGGYVGLGVDLSEGLTLNPDGTFELDVPTVSESVREAVLAKFPGRSITSFLAEDCVLVITYIDGNGDEQELRAPLVRETLDVSPLSEFLARELGESGDFENLDVAEVSAVLAQVEGTPVSADGVANIEELLNRIEDVAGPQVRESVAAARLPEADAALRDGVVGIYDVVSVDFQVFGAEDPNTGGPAGFGRMNVITDIFNLDIGAGSGDDGVRVVDGSLTELLELELNANDFGGGVNYNLRALSEEEDIGDDLAGVDGVVSGDGSMRFPLDASQSTDPEAGEGDIEAATTLRLLPAGDSGAYALRAPFRGADYQLNENDALDLARRQGREFGIFYGLAFRRSETAGSLDGRYGSVGLSVRALNNGDLSLEGVRLVRNIDGTAVSSDAAVRSIERNTGEITASTGSATGVQETLDVTGRELVLSDAEGDTLEGLILAGGGAYAGRLLDSEVVNGDTPEAASDLELGFRLGATAPDISGARYQLQTLQFELGSASSNGAAFLLFEAVSNGVLEIPESGMAEGATLNIQDLVIDFVERDNDAAPLRVGVNRGETEAALAVSSYDAASSLFELVNVGADPLDGTLPGFISADGNVIAFALYEELFDTNGATEGGLTGIAIGTRID